MTTAQGIEIAIGPSPALVRSQLTGKPTGSARGTVWAGAEPSSGISSGGESFRSGLQSLLASMGTGNENSSIKRAAALPALERPFAEAGLRDAGATCGNRVNPLSVQGRMQKVEIAAGRTVSSLPDSQASLPYLNSSPLTPEATIPAAAKQGGTTGTPAMPHCRVTAMQPGRPGGRGRGRTQKRCPPSRLELWPGIRRMLST